jgi:predicted HTH domain antitoxin
MGERLQIEIPDHIRKSLNRTPQELAQDMRLYSALMMFQLGKLSAGAAAELAGVPKVAFLDLCDEHGISVSEISPDDLRKEVED